MSIHIFYFFFFFFFLIFSFFLLLFQPDIFPLGFLSVNFEPTTNLDKGWKRNTETWPSWTISEELLTWPNEPSLYSIFPTKTSLLSQQNYGNQESVHRMSFIKTEEFSSGSLTTFTHFIFLFLSCSWLPQSWLYWRLQGRAVILEKVPDFGVWSFLKSKFRLGVFGRNITEMRPQPSQAILSGGK